MNWTEGLKKDDLVIVKGYSNFLGVTKTILKVDRLTKTLIILENGDKYRKKDKIAVGSERYSVYKITEATTEKIKKIEEEEEKSKLIYEIEKIDFEKMTNDQLKEILKKC